MLAKLEIRILADDVLVAESDSPDLWAAVLGEIQRLGAPCLPSSASPPVVCVGHGSEPCRSKPGAETY